MSERKAPSPVVGQKPAPPPAPPPASVATTWICTRCKGVSTTPGEALRHECADRKEERELVVFLREPETVDAIERTMDEALSICYDWADYEHETVARLRELVSRIAALAGPAKGDS